MSGAFWRHGHVVRRSHRREADGELSHICCWCQQGLLRRALFLQHGQYRAGAPACQMALGVDRPISRFTLPYNDLSAIHPPRLEPRIVMGLTRNPPFGASRAPAPPVSRGRTLTRIAGLRARTPANAIARTRMNHVSTAPDAAEIHVSSERIASRASLRECPGIRLDPRRSRRWTMSEGRDPVAHASSRSLHARAAR